MMLRTKPAMCAAVSIALSIGGCSGSDEPISPRAGGGEPTETACPYVEARPTYLPWVDDGGEVPPPRQTAEDGTSYVAWSTDEADPSEQKSVILRRDAEPLGGRGEPVSTRLEGAKGYYYAAPGSQASVLWKTDADSCNLITLTLSLPGSDRAELRDEILKIVESLES